MILLSGDEQHGAAAVHWLSLGELSKLIDTFKRENVSRAVMAGQVKHKQIFSSIRPDWKLAKLLLSLGTRNTDSLLGAVAKMLAASSRDTVRSAVTASQVGWCARVASAAWSERVACWADSCSIWPRVSVSRSIFALVDDRDRMYFGRGGKEGDQVGMLSATERAIFGRSYAAEPDKLIEQLRQLREQVQNIE